MGRSLFCSVYNDNTLPSSAAYWTPGSAQQGWWFLTDITTEARAQLKMKLAGTIARMEVHHSNSGGLAGTAALRVAAADSALAVDVVDDGETHAFDRNHDDSITVADGDLVDFRFTAGMLGISYYSVRTLFDPTAAGNAGIYTLFMEDGQTLSGTASAERYLSVAGVPEYPTPGSTTAANVRMKIRSAGTLQAAQIYVKSNSRTTDTLFQLMKYSGGVESATGVQITVAAAATGLKEPSSAPTASLADADYVYWKQTNGTGSGNIVATFFSCAIATAALKTDIRSFYGRDDGKVFLLSSGSAYSPLCGPVLLATGNAELVQFRHGFNGVATRLRAYVSSNTATVATRIYFVVADVRSSLYVEYAAGETGEKEADGALSAAFGCEDLCHYEMTRVSAGSGSVRVLAIDVLEEDTGTPCDDEGAPAAEEDEEDEERPRCWTFDLDGHTFYVLDLATEGTFLYDDTTGQWAKWQTAGYDGEWNMRRGIMWNGMILAGDSTGNTTWQLDPAAVDDEGIPARGTLTFTAGAIANDIVRIDGVYYQFAADPTAGTPDGSSGTPYLVDVGSTDAVSLQNLMAAINATGTAGTTYSEEVVQHATVEAWVVTATTLKVRARTTGTAGNAIVTTVTAVTGSDGLAWGAATLADGAAAVEIEHAVTGMVTARSRDGHRQDNFRLAASSGYLADATTPATVRLRWSDDNGHTWTAYRTIALENAEYSQELAFLALGTFSAPGRIFEVSDLGGVIRIDGADGDIEGMSDGPQG